MTTKIDKGGLGRPAVVMAMLLAGSVLEGAAQTAKTLGALTAPPASLPSGCALVPSSWAPPSGTTIIGVPTPDFPSNPWFGTQRQLVAAVREAVHGAPFAPSGTQPPNRATTDAIKPGLTEDVVEAYRAVYMSAQGTPVVVLAIRYTEVKLAEAEPQGAAKLPLVVRDRQTLSGRLVRGTTVVSLSTAADAPNPCFDALSAFVWTFK